MRLLSAEVLAELLSPYLDFAETVPHERLFEQLAIYLRLLLQWNEKTNLTSIRDPGDLVRRHFGESLLLGGLLPRKASTLLDFGSGAGFPGIPIQLQNPGLAVVLAESQGKKAAFLREVVRALGLTTTVHQGRVEALAPRAFDVVTLRAVDKMERAIPTALRFGPKLLLLTTNSEFLRNDLVAEQLLRIPGQRDAVAVLAVPRGTL